MGAGFGTFTAPKIEETDMISIIAGVVIGVVSFFGGFALCAVLACGGMYDRRFDDYRE